MKQWYSSEYPFYPGMFTPEQKAMIMRSEVYVLARAVAAMSEGALLISSSAGRGLTMSTRSGFNGLFLQHFPVEKKGRYRITRYMEGDGDSHWVVGSSNNINYLLRKMKTDDDSKYSFERATKYGDEEWYDGVMRRLINRYIKKLAKNSDVDLTTELQFDSPTQEWMLRYIAGSCSTADFPNNVRNIIDIAARRYEKKEQFLQKAHEHSSIMFDREKWLVCHLSHGYVIAGIDTRSSVKLIADAMMCGGQISHSTQTTGPLFKFTYEPRMVKSLDAVEESIRSSLLSSLMMYKVGREAAHGAATGIDKDGYFVSLDNADNQIWLSNEGGWSTWRNSHYANWIVVDKDPL